MLRYAITDGLSWPRSDRNEVARVPGSWTALAGLGVDVIVVREPRLSASELTKLTRQILAEVRLGPARVLGVTRVLVARRLDVALAAAADGVHLSSGAGELSPAQVRRLMPGAHITQSAHRLEEVRRIEGADAILFAPVFGKMVDGREVSPPAGLALLREACRATSIPVLALGGVTPDRIEACLNAGAAGVAGIRLFAAGRDQRA